VGWHVLLSSHLALIEAAARIVVAELRQEYT
jgi:hypothetical protein